MIIELTVFILTTILAYCVYVHKKVRNQFDKIDVRYVPGLPIFGNVFKSTFLKRHIIDDLDAVYKAYPDERYVGYLEGTTPILMIRDPDLIKAITVKDFDHFVNHRMFLPDDTEPLLGGSLLMMQGEKWREMRTTLSPAFTGSKMKQMMPFMLEISENIVDYLKDHQTEEIDVDDLMHRYTNDVIASAGFGISVNSLKDRDNDFYKTGQGMFKFTSIQRAYLFLSAQFPWLAKLMGIKVFPEKTTNFFRQLVSSTIDYRIKNNVQRPDMIQLLMEASRGTLKYTGNTNEKNDVGFAAVEEYLKPREHTRHWTDDELTSQVFIFFVAGFESSAATLVMCVHELAINPGVQEKLYQEIKEYSATGPLNYDRIGELKYLDCVLNETTRKWSAAIVLDRVCHKSYELPPPREGGKPVMVKKGDLVYNMVNTLHMDAKHFSDPETFNPERFADENKHNIKPFTFLPFGSGPRNCIGSRFALLELKVIIYDLVKNYRIVKTPKTLDPLRLELADFKLIALGGTSVRFESRQ